MNKRAFTLIELLITITIIAILSGISIFALSGSRESARDARRKSDLETIRTALEMYKADCGAYPASLPVGTSLVGSGSGSCLVTNVYLQKVPSDPSSGNYSYNRLTTSSYALCTNLEDPPTSLPPLGDCAACTNGNGGGCKYIVYNP